MATLQFTRSHAIPVEEAVGRIKVVIADFQNRYAKHVSSVVWSSDGRSATASGKRFKARFSVDEQQVRISVDLLGIMAKLLRGKVEERVTQQLDSHFPLA